MPAMALSMSGNAEKTPGLPVHAVLMRGDLPIYWLQSREDDIVSLYTQEPSCH